MVKVEKVLQLLSDRESRLPKPLRVLVKLSKPAGRRSGECVALCMQYPVHATGSDQVEAVVELLNNLVNHLAFCERNNEHAVSYAPPKYQEAFDFGPEIDDIDLNEIKKVLDVSMRVGKDLQAFLRKQVDLREAREELELVGAAG
jgi:hypothetical protein